MNSRIVFREIRQGEEEGVCRLVLDVFNKFVAPGYSAEGVKEMNRYVNPESMRLRLANQHFILLALDVDKIVGAIEARNNSHISLFFVDKKYQNQGIGKTLTELAVNKCRLSRPDIQVIDVNSSPYAVPTYERMGFVKQSEEQITNGMRYTPMALRL